MFGLDQFNFVAIWKPVAMTVTAVIILLYWLTVGRWGKRLSHSEPVLLRKKLSFTLGVIVIYFAMRGPLSLIGHLTFTGHMISMSVSYMLAPPLLLYGLPAWLLRPFLQDKAFSIFRRIFLNPIVTLLFFNIVFSLYHIPVIHDFVMTNYVVHTLYYILLLAAALMLWWPIVCPVPEEDTLSDLKKMFYVFLAGALLTPACALIIFSPKAVYGTFNDPLVWAKALAWCVPGSPEALLHQFSGPDAFHWMTPRNDQQLGGVVMKLFQETVYGVILAYVFKKWYSNERGDDPEPELDSDALPGQLGQA